jgi:hypothetical protein
VFSPANSDLESAADDLKLPERAWKFHSTAPVYLHKSNCNAAVADARGRRSLYRLLIFVSKIAA